MRHNMKVLPKAFVILSVCFALGIAVFPKLTFSQQSGADEKREISATIMLPSSVAVGTTLTELTFATQYEFSGYLIANSSTITIPQGFFGMGLEGNVTNVEAYDNQGHTFYPFINQTGIFSPAVNNLPVQIGSLYILTMNFTTQSAVTYDASSESFNWGMTVKSGQYPAILTVNLPSDFTLVGVTPEANETSEGEYNVTSWSLPPYVTSTFEVEFLPFTMALTSMRITAQVMAISSNSEAKMTFNMSYIVRGSSFLMLNVPMDMNLSISCPTDTSSNLDVLSVADGEGECNETPSPLTFGTYLIDWKTNQVVLVPRDTYQNTQSEGFDVQAVYTANIGNTNIGIHADVPIYEPYESPLIMLFNFTNFGDFEQNFEIFQMNIMFPAGVDQIQSQTGTPMLEGSVNSGFTAVYNYDNPTQVPSYWILTYQQPPLRNLYYQQLDTLFLFVICFVTSLGLYLYIKKTKVKIVAVSYVFTFSDGALTGYLGYRVIDSASAYQSLSNLSLWYTVVLIFEAICLVGAIVLFAHPVIKQVRSGNPNDNNLTKASVKDETPKNQEPAEIDHESNKKDNTEISDVTSTNNKSNKPE